jgi:hypothetical protein
MVEELRSLVESTELLELHTPTAAPSLPLLAVAGTNCRGDCARGCGKLFERPRPSSLSFLHKALLRMEIGELLETVQLGRMYRVLPEHTVPGPAASRMMR